MTWLLSARAGRLGLLGAVQLALYGGVVVLSESFTFGASERPILEVVALFSAATLCWFLALFLVLRRREEDAGSLRIILLFAVLGRLLMLPSQPILEIDYYRYLWDGRVTSLGFNPYHYTPWQVRDTDEEDQPSPELRALGRLAVQSEALRTIFQRVDYADVPTAYPPASQGVFALAAWLTPVAAPLTVHVLVLKAVLLLFDLATLAVIVALLRQLRLPATWCVAYAWCPLVLKEVANSGHLDSIAVFFTTLALYLLVRRPTVLGACGGMACLGLGVLAKSYPVVLLPVVAAYLLGLRGKRALLPLSVLPLVVLAGYLPFVGGPAGEISPLTRPHHPGTGLTAFLTQWETNDFLFMLVYHNLRPSPDETDGRYVLVPRTCREEWQRDYLDPWGDALGLPLKAQPAFVLTQALMGAAGLALCLGWAGRVFGRPEPGVLLHYGFLTLAWAWLLTSAANPWYLLWSLPLIVFSGRWSWFLLPGLAWLYYVRFWLDALPWSGRPMAPDDVVWLEYVPFFAALLIERWVAKPTEGLRWALRR